MMPVPLVEAFEQAWLGGKAVQLGAAIRAGLPVPPGFALSVDLVDAIASGDESSYQLVLPLLPQLGGVVAVRSSAVGEDSASASFAGQHLTLLNVRADTQLLTAIREVWASGRSESALAYRQRLGISEPPQVAVVIQQLVHPDCAGVLFTRNPVTNADEIVIEAAWGLGEAIVAGLITPDRYRLSRDGQVLEQTPGFKDLAIQPTAEGGTMEVEVEPDQIEQLCLDQIKLQKLATLATQCEEYFQKSGDLEWAFKGETLYLLQCRPITRSFA